MKKILLSGLSLLLVSGFSFGQTFTTQYGDTSVTASSGVGEVKVHNDITNVSANINTYDWRITGSNFPTDWSYGGVCDNKTCYTSAATLTGTTVQSTSNVKPDSTMQFYAAFNDDGAANGTVAWLRLSIAEPGTLIPRPLTFIATKGATSAVTVVRSEDEIVLYPNPAKSAINIIYDASLGVKSIGVYNLIGKMVSVYKVGANSAKLDIDELPSGIYFIRMFDNQGKVVATRKFTHQ